MKRLFLWLALAFLVPTLSGSFLAVTPAHQGGRTGLRPSGSANIPATVQGGALIPTFDLSFADGSGVSKLSSSLAVNGVAMTHVAGYRGQDGTSTTLTSYGTGPTLSCGSCEADIPAPFTDETRGVRGSGSDFYASSENATGDFDADDDIVIEVVVRANTATAAGMPLAKYPATGGGYWYVQLASNGSLDFVMSDGTDSASTAAISGGPGLWHYGIFFVDRSETSGVNGIRGYDVNGASSNGTGNPSLVGAIDSGALSLGGASGYNLSTGAVAWASVWTCNGCMAGGATNPTQWATIARERSALLTGVSADVARGQPYPSSFTRASAARLDIDRDADGVRRLFSVGNGWPRVVRRPDGGGTLRLGYLAEAQATNLVLQSETFGTTWALVDSGDSINSDAALAPTGLATADDVIADSTDGQHGVTQAVTVTATTYTFSAWAKAGSQGHLYISNDTVANAYSYFDLNPCAVGTNGVGASGERAEDWGNGWCRVSIAYIGTAASHTHRIGCAPADGDNTFAGDGAAPACTLYGAQVEAQPVATSYIVTTTGSTTRNADALVYASTDNYVANATHTIDAEFFIADHEAANPSQSPIVSTGSGGTYQIILSDGAASDSCTFIAANASVTQWSISGSGGADVSNGALHSCRLSAETNNVRAWIDGAARTTDTSATLFSAADLGVFRAAVYAGVQVGVTTRLRIWDRAVAP